MSNVPLLMTLFNYLLVSPYNASFSSQVLRGSTYAQMYIYIDAYQTIVFVPEVLVINTYIEE